MGLAGEGAEPAAPQNMKSSTLSSLHQEVGPALRRGQPPQSDPDHLAQFWTLTELLLFSFFSGFLCWLPPRSSPSSPLPDHVRCSVSFLCVLFAPVVFAVVSSSALSRANLPPRSVNDPQKHNNKRLLLICIFNGDSWTNYIFIDYRADRGRGGMMPLAMQVGTRVPSAPASVKGRRGPGAQHCVLLVLVYFVFRNNNYYWAVYK